MNLAFSWHPLQLLRTPEPIRTAFYHDLHARSGFGDRLMDLWGAITVGRLLDPDGQMTFRWNTRGIKFQAFRSAYALELFNVANSSTTDVPPRGALVPIRKRYDEDRVEPQCIRPLPGGARQIILRSGSRWGTSSPSQLYEARSSYGLDNVSERKFAETYREVAAETRPGDLIAAALPSDLDGRIGIHGRLTDKISERINDFEMTSESWARIEARVLLEIDKLVEEGHRFFVCADDRGYRDDLVAKLRSRGADTIASFAIDSDDTPPGFADLVDFFALSHCREIVQLTKYSTFSIGAALVGGAELKNLSIGEDPDGTGNRIRLWESALLDHP